VLVDVGDEVVLVDVDVDLVVDGDVVDVDFEVDFPALEVEVEEDEEIVVDVEDMIFVLEDDEVFEELVLELELETALPLEDNVPVSRISLELAPTITLNAPVGMIQA
jgi:translation elongation factor P/translation initiation factor 5A